MPVAPEERWADIAETELSRRTNVTAGTGFGRSQGLRVAGEIFAMFIQDELVVKLPKRRVDDLVSAGAARQFDPGHGRLMKEWAALSTSTAQDWPAVRPSQVSQDHFEPPKADSPVSAWPTIS
jgi:hypothetical protein